MFGGRYYRDAAQPAPQPEEETKEQANIDPEELLREAEERVEDFDEVVCCFTAGITAFAAVHAEPVSMPVQLGVHSACAVVTGADLLSGTTGCDPDRFCSACVQIQLLDLKGLRRMVNLFERRVRQGLLVVQGS